MDATTDDDRISFVAAHSRLPNGQLVIERIVHASNVILAARRAKWPPRLIEIVTDGLVSELERFRVQAKRVEGG
jgi:hypothetical protein